MAEMRRPDIILLTADSLRADRLGCYGYTRPLSPNLDRLARHGTLFTQAFSNGPNTPHAFPAILAGRCSLLSRRLGLFDHPMALAEIFKRAGYVTVGFNTGNPYVSRHFGYDRGFDEFTDYIDFELESAPQPAGARHISVPRADMERYLVTEDNIRAKADLETRFVEDVCQRLARRHEMPLFLWVHFMDTHYPYLPQAQPQEAAHGTVISRKENYRLNLAVRGNAHLGPDDLRKVTRLYDACVRQLDAKVGRILSALEPRAMLDNTLVLFCADHGEEFMEHGDLQHKSKLYDELIHVPLLLKLPAQKRGATSDKAVSLLQIASTLAAAGTENPFPQPPLTVPGAAPIFAAASIGAGGGTPVDHHMNAVNRLPAIYSYREGCYKIVLRTSGQTAVFNLLSDPAERSNVYDAQSEHHRSLENKLQEHILALEEQRLRESAERIVSGILSKGEPAHAA